jgi:PAS domain S-box-containing protein
LETGLEPEHLLVVLARQVGALALLVVPYTLLFDSRLARASGRRIAFGFIAGLIAILGMMSPMVFTTGFLLDGKSAVCLLTGLYGGTVPGVVAGTMAGLYRWWMGGAGAPIGTASIAASTLFGLLLRLLLKRTGDRRLAFRHLLAVGLALTAVVQLLMFIVLGWETARRLMEVNVLPMTLFNVSAMLIAGTLLEREKRRHKAEADLKESDALHRLITESANDIILKIDHGRRISYISASARDVLGYDPASLLGHDVSDLILEDRTADMGTIRQRLGEAGDSGIFTVRVRHSAGHLVWMEVAVRQVADPRQGNPVLVAVARDVSRRKQAEAELVSARFHAEAANRAKSSFLAAMSHELRTPLNAIIGFSEMIEKEVLGPVGTPTYKEYAGDIRHGGQHLLTVVNNILDLSKIEAGRMELDEQPTDLNRLVLDMMRLMRPQAEAAGIEVEFRTGHRQLHAVVDETRFKQILLNLFSNAIKFTPSGGHVVIALELDEEGGLELQVSDTGTGIAAQDIPLVLEPFGQAGGDVMRMHNGTGLGLPLARLFVEMHGGSLHLDSTPGLGTRVRVRLPPARVRYAEPGERRTAGMQ